MNRTTPPRLTVAPTIGRVGCPTMVMFNAPPPSLLPRGYDPAPLRETSNGVDFCNPETDPELLTPNELDDPYRWTLVVTWESACHGSLRVKTWYGRFVSETVLVEVPSGPAYSRWGVFSLTTPLNTITIRQAVVDAACATAFIGTCPTIPWPDGVRL